MEDRKSCCSSYFHHLETVMHLTPLWEQHSVPFEMVAAYCSGYFLLNIFNDLQCKFCFTSKPHRADLLYASCEPLCSRYTIAYCCQHIFGNLYFSDRMVLIKKSLFKISFTFDFYKPNSHFFFPDSSRKPYYAFCQQVSSYWNLKSASAINIYYYTPLSDVAWGANWRGWWWYRGMLDANDTLIES